MKFLSKIITKPTSGIRGGVRVGLYGATWPNGVMDITDKALTIYDELHKEKYMLLRSDIVKIEPKFYFPFFGHGVCIYHSKNYAREIDFWVFYPRYKKLIATLKKFNYL